MRFDLEDLNPGTWFLLDEDNPEQGRVCLRVLNNEARKRIDEATIQKDWKFNPQNHQRYEDVKINEDMAERMLWDYTIVDWEGILDADGEPIPCTADNKVALLHGSPKFARIMMGCQSRLLETLEVEAEETEKN